MKIRLVQRAFFATLLLLFSFAYAQAQGRTATVISERAHLRESPSFGGEVKREIAIGTTIKVLDRKGAWYVVRVDDAVGWIHGNAFRFGGAPLNTDRGNTSSYPVITSPPRAPRARSDSGLSGGATSSPATGSGSTSASSSGRTYIRGPRGGCYYFSGSGKKVYVDRSLCN